MAIILTLDPKGPSNSRSSSSNSRSFSAKLKGQVLRGLWPGGYIYGTWWLSPQGYVFLTVDGWIVFFPELCEGTPPFGWIWTTSLRCHLILKIVDKDLIRGILKWPPSGYVIPADQCASPFGAIIHHNPLHRFLVLDQYNGMIERFEHYSYTHTC